MSFKKSLKNEKAVIVIDMLEDFVYGALKNVRAKRIIPKIAGLVNHARKKGWIVVYANDAHLPGDPEEKVWGPHAMAGSKGAQVISELKPKKHTHICVRHTCADAFARNYKITVPEDGVESFSDSDHKNGLEYLKICYGANIVKTSSLIV